MKDFTREELLTFPWICEETVDYVLEQQELLSNDNAKIRVEDVYTDHPVFKQFVEEQKQKLNLNLEIIAYDIEAYLVWVKDCSVPLELDKCSLTEKDEKRWIIKNISQDTYFTSEEQTDTTIIGEITVITDEEDAFSTIEYLNDVREDAYTLIEY